MIQGILSSLHYHSSLTSVECCHEQLPEKNGEGGEEELKQGWEFPNL